MKNFVKLVLVGAVSALFLSACGGGGESSASTTQASQAAQAVSSFPLQTGYKALIANGSTNSFTISGTCSGSAAGSVSVPSAGTFGGSPALLTNGTLTFNFTNCTPASGASTSTAYYDSNYNLLGHAVSGVEYGKFQVVPSPLPTSVKVGDTAVFGAETLYTDSTKQTTLGQRIDSYVIEADGTSINTAIVNLIVKTFNSSNQLLGTQQSRFRIVANGTLTAVSIDVQYSTTSSAHLVYTAN